VAITAAVLVVLVAGGTFFVVASSPSGREDAVALDAIADGVSLQHVGDRALIFVRDGDSLTAFSQVDERGDRVVWCPDVSRFTTLRDGSQYGSDGRRLGGPAPDDLTRVALRRAGGRIYASTTHEFGYPVATWSDFVAGAWTSARDGACPHP